VSFNVPPDTVQVYTDYTVYRHTCHTRARRRPFQVKYTQTHNNGIVKGMSDERQNRPILSADKIAPQKSVMCHAKIAGFYRPTK